MTKNVSISQMKKALFDMYAVNLSKSSKWYKEDIANYKTGLNSLTDYQVKERYDRQTALNSKAFGQWCGSYVDKLDRAGMYNKPLTK
jgi:hypothetical protein